MSGDQAVASRFTLNEERAKAHLARTIDDAYDPYTASPGRTSEVLTGAFVAGVVTDSQHPPGRPLDDPCLTWDPMRTFLNDDPIDYDYRWLLVVGGELTVVSQPETSWAFGPGEHRGAGAALLVLREAVREGNALAQNLDAYCRSRPGSP